MLSPGHRIEVRDLRKTYRGRRVVDGISLRAESGEIVGLLGPNGAGKTTTFHAVVGLTIPDGGTILLDGDDVSREPMYKRARRGIGYLPQEPSVFHRLTVRQNLMVAMELMGLGKHEGRARTEEIIGEFRLTHVADNLGSRLSGGERRRLEIARALAMNPRFLLLDEPFAGIDPITIDELKGTITELRDRGLGILITDHNVRDTLAITDRAYIISEGNVLKSGAPDELIQSKRVRATYLGEGFHVS